MDRPGDWTGTGGLGTECTAASIWARAIGPVRSCVRSTDITKGVAIPPGVLAMADGAIATGTIAGGIGGGIPGSDGDAIVASPEGAGRDSSGTLPGSEGST